MSNQSSDNGRASPKLQPTSNDTSGQAPPVVALTNPSTAPATSQSSTSPDGVKVPHVIEPDGVKVPHV
jgi:hypothetical protein